MENLHLKKIRPVTPSSRGLKLLKRAFLKEKKFIKKKTFGFQRCNGRNHGGKITAFHRGGGHKRLYRTIDFHRLSSEGVVEGIEYDPFRTAFLARVYDYVKKEHFYILAPKNLWSGSLISSGENADIRVGHAMPLSNIPVGSLVHNLGVMPKKKGQIARAAGTFVQLIQKTKDYGRVRLPSGEQRLVPIQATATLGVVANENQWLATVGKAGRSRWKNRRPKVRGVAMNPIDHPHGGGEGKTSGGRPSVTPWGKPTKGPKTSRSRNPFVLVKRKK
jgi:large subunit ribosomal protein L2